MNGAVIEKTLLLQKISPTAEQQLQKRAEEIAHLSAMAEIGEADGADVEAKRKRLEADRVEFSTNLSEAEKAKIQLPRLEKRRWDIYREALDEIGRAVEPDVQALRAAVEKVIQLNAKIVAFEEAADHALGKMHPLQDGRRLDSGAVNKMERWLERQAQRTKELEQ